MDFEEIKRNYERFDDEKLIQLATKEIKTLRKGVIPILEAELAKRKISISEKKEKSGDEKIEKGTKTSNDEKNLMNQMNEFMNSFEIPHILKSGKKYYVNTSLLFLISIIISSIILFLFKPFFGSGLKLIIYITILTVLITIALRKLKIGKIVDIQSDKIILSKYPKMNYGVFRILVLIQILLNSIEKIQINNIDILKIYQRKNLTDKGFYIEVIDKHSKNKNNYRVFLESLLENDKAQVMEVIKLKIMESKNVA